MVAYVCRTCGVQQAPGVAPPVRCAICEDERQYVGWGGQRWATLEELRGEGFRTVVREEEPGLVGIGVEPQLGIGQRALLVRTPGGNLLWDIPGYVDDEAVEKVRELGGVAAISASHPHFYGVIVEWSHAFDGAPIYLPRTDAEWVGRPDPAIRWYGGRVEPVPGVSLLVCGGHFEGSAVAHWPAGAGGRGALLVGDTIQVVADRRWVSFMRSYPNYLPLPPAEVNRIVAAVEPLAFDRIYGGWWDRNVAAGGKHAVRSSAERYRRWVAGPS